MCKLLCEEQFAHSGHAKTAEVTIVGLRACQGVPQGSWRALNALSFGDSTKILSIITDKESEILSPKERQSSSRRGVRSWRS